MGFLDEPVSAAKHEATWAFLRSCSIPVYRANERQQVPIGTGTLIEVCETKYLVTAAHVAREASAGTLAVPTDRTLRRITTLGRCSVIQAREDKHDVALVALEDQSVVAALASWRFLSLENLGTPWFAGPFLLFGYLEAKQVRPGPNLPSESIGLVLGKYEGDVNHMAEPFDPQNDMLLEWPSRPITIDGESIVAPQLQGLSGCSVWAMEPESGSNSSIWTPTKQLRLVAIQSAAVQGQYIRVKRWHLLWSAFRYTNKKAASAVRRTMNAHRKRLKTAHVDAPPPRRIRRTPDQMIADLQKQIAAVRARAAEPKPAPVPRPPRVRPAVATRPADSPVAITATTPSLDARIEARVHAFTVDLVALIKRAALESVRSALTDLGDTAMPDTTRELMPEPPLYVVTPARPPKSRAPANATTDPVSFLAYERMAIQRAIAESDGNLVAAARQLNAGKSTMYRRMKAVGLDRPSQGGANAVATDDPVLAAGVPVRFEAYERAALVRALDESGGSKLDAARLLKVGKSTLEKHGVG